MTHDQYPQPSDQSDVPDQVRNAFSAIGEGMHGALADIAT